MRGGKNITLFLSSLPVPKTNRYLRKKNGQVFKPPRVSLWEIRAVWELKNQYSGKPLNKPIKVEVFFFLPDRRKRDIDNMLKTLWDILEKAQIIENDNLIFETRTVKVAKNSEPGTVIRIYPYKNRRKIVEELYKELMEFKKQLEEI
jgi:crossover junction endodeoxyribonuclease RusA